MPGEQALIEVAKGWTGPEAALLAVVAVAAIVGCVGLWTHVRDCRSAMNEIKGALSTLKETVARIDERTKKGD